MPPSILFLIFAVLFASSLFLLKKKTPFTSRRRDDYVTRKQSIRLLGVLLLFPAGLSLVLGILLRMNSVNLPEPETNSSGPYANPLTFSLSQTLPRPVKVDPEEQLRKEKELKDELDQLTAKLNTNPQDFVAYGDRGNVHAARKEWSLAEDDYRSGLQINAKLAKAAFNLAEMEFAQKKYDDARPGFVALKLDKNLGDLAAYKVFLCDLYGGHETLANKELDEFNQAGTDASYYFANIAWFLYYKKTDHARDWLNSAYHIYEPYKIDLYSSTLTELGYLPLPDQ
jgi:hypothetical protein